MRLYFLTLLDRQKANEFHREMTFLWETDKSNSKALCVKPTGISPGVRHRKIVGRTGRWDHGRQCGPCLLSPQDGSVDQISWIALDIRASRWPEGSAPRKPSANVKCHLNVFFITPSLISDFIGFHLSVFPDLWWSAAFSEWHSGNAEIKSMLRF